MTRKNGPAPTAPRTTAECRQHGLTLHALYRVDAGRLKKCCLLCKAVRRRAWNERARREGKGMSGPNRFKGITKSRWRKSQEPRPKAARPTGIAGYTKGETLVRSCRVCGCTDRDCRTCVLRTGAPCSWVAKDLCSACVVM